MLFPIGDDDREVSSPCLVTKFLLFANILVFLYQFLINPAFTYAYSVVPVEILTGTDLVEAVQVEQGGRLVEIPQEPGPSPIWLTLISSMFMHGGIMHLLGNMFFLWIFGNNVEHRFGSKSFLLFYLGAGIFASLAHVLLNKESLIPSLGASGAIAGILGAYLVLFPRNKVKAIVFIVLVSLPAFAVIGLWFVSQLFGGFGALFETAQTGGVAYSAHIGGFVAGLVIAGLYRAAVLRKAEPDTVIYRHYRADPTSKRLW